MIDDISISLKVGDSSLAEELRVFIAEDSLLRLSDENIPCPEEIIITDDPKYLAKTGEILIGIKCLEEKSFKVADSSVDSVIKATKNAYCYWQTAKMNRASVNPFAKDDNGLAQLAEHFSNIKNDSAGDSSNLFESLVEDMPIGLVLVDGEGVVNKLNKKAQEFFKGSDVNPLSRLAEIGLPDDMYSFLSDKDETKEVFVLGNFVKLKKFKVKATTVLVFY
ncbi:MAG: hypothetical protein NE330_18235 [Lentisphaeraceae bacterium]|nr:hypothetical protein [Lentisphaeraceae bacterium]